MKRVLSVVLVVFTLAMLAACGGGGSDDPAVGTWKIDSINMSGVSIKMDELDTMEGMIPQEQIDAINSMEIELKADGKMSAKMSLVDASDESTSGTWEKDGDVYKLTPDDGSTLELKYDEENKQLYVEESGMTMYFKKA